MLTIHVVGTPAPQGSKRAFVVNGRAVMTESSKKVKPWRQDVVASAQAAATAAAWEKPAGPVRVDITYYLPRPRYHFRTGKRANELRENAPTYVDKKPDKDKLDRATFDALTTSGVIRDDAQVSVGLTEKRYADAATGARITVTSLSPAPASAPSPPRRGGRGPRRTGAVLMPVIYESLCAQGNRIQFAAKETAQRLHDTIQLLLNAEADYPENVARYRAEVITLKASRDRDDGSLMKHVAHCTAGCKRTAGGPLAFAGEGKPGVYGKAPSHDKPLLPGPGTLAQMLRDGSTLDDLSVEFERGKSRLRTILNDAGFNNVTGQPRRLKAVAVTLSALRVDDQPWAEDGACAQTDPEAFFPEKGGSTRQAKNVCAGCIVQAQCLDYALDHDVRYGIWGGLSERERRQIKKAIQADITTHPLTTQESA